MKIAWAVDAWPCRACGVVRAQELTALGHELCVVTGASASAAQVDGIPLRTLGRSDPFADHWQRSASASALAAFRKLLREESFDVVHVHQWRSLSRDLVFASALEHTPAVVSLHDAWVSCLIGTRVLPRTGAPCDACLSAHPCIACAPRTPWVPIEAQYMAFAEHKAGIVRELALARAVIADDRALAEAVRRHLGDDATGLAAFHEGAELSLASLYEAAVEIGPPDVGRSRDGDWYSERMRAFAEAEWERGARDAGFVRPDR